MRLLTKGSNVFKIAKSDNKSDEYRSCIMFLSPYKLSGANLCPNASIGCVKSCLNTSGLGKTNSVQAARLKRSHFYLEHREAFKAQLLKECISFIKSNRKKGFKTSIRLNGTSDITWEKVFPEIFELDAMYYDYTKNYNKMLNFLEGKLPKNYHVTFSRSEINDKESLDVLNKGGNVAYVFHKTIKMPEKLFGYTVFNGEEDDLRFLNHHGVIGLVSKGRANKDDTGFVIRSENFESETLNNVSLV